MQGWIGKDMAGIGKDMARIIMDMLRIWQGSGNDRRGNAGIGSWIRQGYGNDRARMGKAMASIGQG